MGKHRPQPSKVPTKVNNSYEEMRCEITNGKVALLKLLLSDTYFENKSLPHLESGGVRLMLRKGIRLDLLRAERPSA